MASHPSTLERCIRCGESYSEIQINFNLNLSGGIAVITNSYQCPEPGLEEQLTSAEETGQLELYLLQ
jgi:hypothetical protein